jgi:malonyl CoA-acyl carrier protein transacylase
MFPGQGSQSRGMGRSLFESVPEFTQVEPELDAILGYSVRELCTHGSDASLRETQRTQPCLFVVNALHYFDMVAKTAAPTAVAGHSLGEYNALLAAGAFDLMTGVRLVARRGELMAGASGGAMCAVLGLSVERLEQYLDEFGVAEVDIANLNSPSQTVIAGADAVINRVAEMLQQAGVSCIRLAVSAAFHSRHMVEAAERYANFLEDIPLQPPRLRVAANATGRLYPLHGEPRAMRSLLVRQITNPVRWVDCVGSLRGIGVTTFVECGPGNVLTRLQREITGDPQ